MQKGKIKKRNYIEMTNQYNDNEDNYAKNPLNKKRFKNSTWKDNEEKIT